LAGMMSRKVNILGMAKGVVVRMCKRLTII
jgi:hypothetical protein